jgi:hypothetical protein
MNPTRRAVMRERLVVVMRAFLEPGSTLSEDGAHLACENILLRAFDDAEVTELWEKCRSFWWYA